MIELIDARYVKAQITRREAPFELMTEG